MEAAGSHVGETVHGVDRVGCVPISDIRSDFPILSERARGGRLVYLDNAATTHKPRPVLEAVTGYYTRSNGAVHRALHRLGERATRALEQSRDKVRRFINAASAREIIFTRGATESINMVSVAWGRKFLKAGDRVLLTEMEHHSNLIPWQFLQKGIGVELRFIPFDSRGRLILSDLDRLLDDRVRMVSVTHASNVFGTVNDIRTIIERAHQQGAIVMVDGAQSVPHTGVDVREMDCDFLAFSGHKMFGPMGIGVLYGKEEVLESMDPYMGGGEMIGSVWLDRATFNDLPHKFEAGTPNVAGAVGLGAAVDYLEELGMGEIARYESELTHYALQRLQCVERLELFGPGAGEGARTGVMSFNLGDLHPHDVAQLLDWESIAVRAGHHCAQPLTRKLGVPGTVRASLCFYNTKGEIDRLAAALDRAARSFGVPAGS